MKGIGVVKPGEIIEAIKHPKDTLKAVKRKAEDIKDQVVAIIENKGAREVAIDEVKKKAKREFEDIKDGVNEIKDGVKNFIKDKLQKK